jgi:hypothetical protein
MRKNFPDINKQFDIFTRTLKRMLFKRWCEWLGAFC